MAVAFFALVCESVKCHCRSICSHFNEPIRFKVKDKEHTLGSVTVPIAGLGSSPSKIWLPLQPHKRASEVHGSLQLGCWVASDGETNTNALRTEMEVNMQEWVVCSVVKYSLVILLGGGSSARGDWSQS